MHSDTTISQAEFDRIESELQERETILGMTYVVTGKHEELGDVILVRRREFLTIISEHPYVRFIADGDAPPSGQ